MHLFTQKQISKYLRILVKSKVTYYLQIANQVLKHTSVINVQLLEAILIEKCHEKIHCYIIAKFLLEKGYLCVKHLTIYFLLHAILFFVF